MGWTEACGCGQGLPGEMLDVWSMKKDEEGWRRASVFMRKGIIEGKRRRVWASDRDVVASLLDTKEILGYDDKREEGE